MKFQAHRGVGTEFPENTMPAFVAAVAQGYDYIELDPAFTKDDQCVILHEPNLPRKRRVGNWQQNKNSRSFLRTGIAVRRRHSEISGV